MDITEQALIEKQIQQQEYMIQQNNEIIRLLSFIAEEENTDDKESEITETENTLTMDELEAGRVHGEDGAKTRITPKTNE